MRRLAVAALVAGAALGAVPSAHAAPGGYCDGKVDAACRMGAPCEPDLPCNVEYCLVWIGGDCGIR